jgi:O-acetyl-ADP-ribose deacetylase (regulator of RNase III)
MYRNAEPAMASFANCTGVQAASAVRLASLNLEPGTFAPMRLPIANRLIELRQGDITDECVDAIVNAANAHLAGGGGVDGAIHRRGGPEIMAETARRYPEGCPTGSAVITGAGELPARYVIHAVGPRWRGGNRGEAELLADAYRRSLELALAHGCRSIALPALSTGAYGYPLDQACRVALAVTRQFLVENALPELVRFVLFGAGAYGAFAAALDELRRSAEA